MPTVLRIGPYRFFFYADERREPPHIHITAAEREAKFWLEPMGLVWSEGFRSGELKEIEGLITLHLHLLLEAWHAFFEAR